MPRIKVSVSDVLACEQQKLLYANIPMQGNSAVRVHKAEGLVRTNPNVDVFLFAELGLETQQLQVMAKRLDLNVYAAVPNDYADGDDFAAKVYRRPYTCILAKKQVPISEWDCHPSSMATSIQLNNHWISCVYSHAQAGKVRKTSLAEYLVSKEGLVVVDFNPASSAELIHTMEMKFSRELVNNERTFFRKNAHNHSLDRIFIHDPFPFCGWEMNVVDGFDHGVITMHVKAFDEDDGVAEEDIKRNCMLRFSKKAIEKISKRPLNVDELLDALPTIAHINYRTDKAIRRKK